MLTYGAKPAELSFSLKYGNTELKEEIKRMNDLYHLSQERDLSEEEFAEWEGLKKQYVADFKASLTAQLDNTYVIDDKGNKRKLEKKSGDK